MGRNKVANYFVGEAKYCYKFISETIHGGFFYATLTVSVKHSDSHPGVYKDSTEEQCNLLGCDIMQFGRWVPIHKTMASSQKTAIFNHCCENLKSHNTMSEYELFSEFEKAPKKSHLSYYIRIKKRCNLYWNT